MNLVPRLCRNPYCGRVLPAGHRAVQGWCGSCYQRWLAKGKPADGPGRPRFKPPSQIATARAHAAIHANYLESLEIFRELDRRRAPAGLPLSDQQIAWEMRVTRRTISRYRAAERAAGRGWWKQEPRTKG